MNKGRIKAGQHRRALGVSLHLACERPGAGVEDDSRGRRKPLLRPFIELICGNQVQPTPLVDPSVRAQLRHYGNQGPRSFGGITGGYLVHDHEVKREAT